MTKCHCCHPISGVPSSSNSIDLDDQDDELMSRSAPSLNSNHVSNHSSYNSATSKVTFDSVSIGSSGNPTLTSSANISRHHETNWVRVVERNLAYLRVQLEDFFASRTGPDSSIFVPIICGSILLLYFVNLLTRPDVSGKNEDNDGETDPAFEKNVPVLVKFFTISPGQLLFPYNWLWSALSVLTYPFIELYFYQVVIDILVVSLSTTLIDPLWGKKELLVFFLSINVAVGILSVIHYIVIYAVKGDAVYLYGVKIYGLTGYCAAVCVSIKQLLPDSVIVATAWGKVKNNNMPLASLTVAFLLYLLNLTSGVSVITFFYGSITSWIYLRFIQYHPTNGTRGDLSESFAFATFFPNVLRPLVSLIADSLYTFLVKIKVCPDYASSAQYQSVRVLSNRLTDNFKLPVRRPGHKYHPSGDYEHLNQPRVETL